MTLIKAPSNLATAVDIEGRSFRLSEDKLLGAGGEARVYRVGERAAKVYHPDLPDLPRRAAKLQAFIGGHASLPAEVVAPQALATDPASGAVVGFAMALVEGAHELRRLSQPRAAALVGQDEVLALFNRLREVLLELHAEGIHVGDLNEGNVLVGGTEDRAISLIDADSLGIPGFPCTVAHERFLDPRLYGRDLASSRGLLNAESDWYAFCVLLFQSLARVHPFGGVHPDHPTLLHRAQARHSVLRGDVRLPKVARHPDDLPADLRAHLLEVFEHDRRDPFPACLLRPGRHQWSSPRVPGWAPSAPPTAEVIVDLTGRGHVLAAARQGALRFVTATPEGIFREDGSLVVRARPRLGMRFAISGRRTWVAKGRDLIGLEAGEVVARHRTTLFDGEPALAANSRSAYVISDGWLTETATGKRLGKVLPHQTWLDVGERLGVGFYRAGRLLIAFVFEPGGRLRTIPLTEPDGVGRVLECRAAFDAEHAALSLGTERDGATHRRLWLFDHRGQLLGQSHEAVPADAPLPGLAVSAGRVLEARDDGLGLRAPDLAGGLPVVNRLTQGADAIERADALIRGPSGGLYVVGRRRITLLSPRRTP